MRENSTGAAPIVELQEQSPNTGGFVFISPWMDEHDGKHELWQRQVTDVLESRMPWLARLLQAEGAYVLAGIGQFFIATQARPRDWIEVPPLSECLLLTPWVECDETAH